MRAPLGDHLEELLSPHFLHNVLLLKRPRTVRTVEKSRAFRSCIPVRLKSNRTGDIGRQYWWFGYILTGCISLTARNAD